MSTLMKRWVSSALLAATLVLGGCNLIPREEPLVFKNKAKTEGLLSESGTPEAPPPYEEINIKAQGQRVPVIMYHDVVPERTRESQWFDCSVEELREQFEWMRSEGITPISIKDLYEHLSSGASIPESAIVLTFDDNYQGFYDNAWPLLQEFNYPAHMFVHTGFVGKTQGAYPKMTYDTLRELLKDPKFTVGAHTVNHPENFTELTESEMRFEIEQSKRDLEENLQVPIEFFAYPSGLNNALAQSLTKAAGFKMAVTVENGLAEESPNLMAVNRYVHTRYKKAWEDRERAINGGVRGLVYEKLTEAPITLTVDRIEGVRLALITGGEPFTATSESREGVADFMLRTDAQAGINGTFFAMAAIKSTDNRLVGPCKTPDMGEVIGDEDPTRWPKLRNRPVLMWGKSGLAIVPFQPETMKTDDAFRQLMPDVDNVMLGGAWLVHSGLALSKEEQNIFGSSDIQDPRRRAFVGQMADGQFLIGAARQSVTSAKLAEALVAAGVKYAVLLDSGFSTSLVYDKYILASGHSTADRPSRPVPHAILLRGNLAGDEKLAKETAVAIAKNLEDRKKPEEPTTAD